MRFFKKKPLKLGLPDQGRLLELSDVPDEAFAQKMLGDGFAVEPTTGNMASPIDGTISYIFPTGHAFGVENDDFEILVHIGIDTVELQGNGFTALKSAGQTVTAGETVVKADLAAIAQAGKSIITPVIVTPKGDRKEIVLDPAAGSVEVR